MLGSSQRGELTTVNYAKLAWDPHGGMLVASSSSSSFPPFLLGWEAGGGREENGSGRDTLEGWRTTGRGAVAAAD